MIEFIEVQGGGDTTYYLNPHQVLYVQALKTNPDQCLAVFVGEARLTIYQTAESLIAALYERR